MEPGGDAVTHKNVNFRVPTLARVEGEGALHVEVVAAYLTGRPPRIASTSVCSECKARRVACVMVADGTPCLGPVTHAGCGALCPSFRRGCYGCFGPAETADTAALDRQLAHLGLDERDRQRLWRGFSGWSGEATP